LKTRPSPPDSRGGQEQRSDKTVVSLGLFWGRETTVLSLIMGNINSDATRFDIRAIGRTVDYLNIYL
jgi:hypothetical protein